MNLFQKYIIWTYKSELCTLNKQKGEKSDTVQAYIEFVATQGEDMHDSNLRHSCCNSREGSDEDMLESTDLASNSPTDMFSKITSSLAISDAMSFAPAILSC